MRNSAAIIGTILILTLAPSLASAWGMRGSEEPSTTWDANYMFSDTSCSGASCAKQATGNYVYFNGFEGGPNTAVIQYEFSPNVATLGTANRVGSHINYAMLGVWRDCNGDGYVGFGDHGLMTYRSELLVGPFNLGICLPHAMSNAAPTHNDGTWVHEFIPIGYTNEAQSIATDKNQIIDQQSAVWADGGVPGAPGGYVCFFPENAPVGTYHTMGSITAYTDCWTRGRFTSTLGQAGLLSTWVSTVEPIHHPWGEESDPSMVSAFDCSRPQSAHVALTHNGAQETFGIGVSQPMVPVVRAPPARLYQNGDPSLAGTTNETVTNMDDCNRANNNGQTDGAVAHQPYSLENAGVSDQVAGQKIRNDPMYYNEVQRINGIETGDAGTGEATPQGTWIAFTIALLDNAFVDVFGPQAQGPIHSTYYAYVSPTAVSAYGLNLPTTTPGSYGSEACGAFTTGIHRGWQCDAAKWDWGAGSHAVCINPTGPLCQYDTQAYLGRMRAQAPFNLRDVDCYDSSIDLLRQTVSWATVTGNPDCLHPGN